MGVSTNNIFLLRFLLMGVQSKWAGSSAECWEVQKHFNCEWEDGWGRGRRRSFFLCLCGARMAEMGSVQISSSSDMFCFLFVCISVPQWQLHLTTTPTSLSTSLLVSTANVCVAVCLQTAVTSAVFLWNSISSEQFLIPLQSLIDHHVCPKALAAGRDERKCFVCCQEGWGWGWLLLRVSDGLAITSNAAGGEHSVWCASVSCRSAYFDLVKHKREVSNAVITTCVFLLRPCLQLCTCNPNYSMAVMLVNLEGRSQVQEVAC